MGAASRMSFCWDCQSWTMALVANVFPQPGPPVSTISGALLARITAAFCPSLSGLSLPARPQHNVELRSCAGLQQGILSLASPWGRYPVDKTGCPEYISVSCSSTGCDQSTCSCNTSHLAYRPDTSCCLRHQPTERVTHLRHIMACGWCAIREPCIQHLLLGRSHKDSHESYAMRCQSVTCFRHQPRKFCSSCSREGQASHPPPCAPSPGAPCPSC